MGIVVTAGLDEGLPKTVDADVFSVDDVVDEALGPFDEPVDLFILGTGISNPVESVRRIAERHDHAGILILFPPEREDALREDLRFAPFLPKHVRSCRADRPDEISVQVETMIFEARQRRRYDSFVTSIRETLPTYERGKHRADVFLDVLLQHAPLGVLLVDDGRVLDVNAEAGRLLDVSIDSARGSALLSLFPEPSRREIDDLMERTRMNPDRPQKTVVWYGPDEPQREVEVTAARPAEIARTVGTLMMLHDVTDRMAAQRAEARLRRERAVSQALEEQADELRRLNEELERSNRELQEFAHVASHDLQEPLRKVVSFADLLMQEHMQEMSEEAQFLLERLQSASLRMSEMIRGLVGFSRVRTRSEPFQRIDLNDVVEDVISDLVISIEKTNAQIDVSDLPEVEGDASQLRRLFQNLIANSLKFHKSGDVPRIRIRTEPAAEATGRHRIVLSDDGIGFDEGLAEKIFEPFQRLHARDEYVGTGMGLTICRRIVERHGGTIDAKSQPGEGVEFTIELPAHRNAPGESP